MKKDNISFNKFNIFHHIRSGGRQKKDTKLNKIPKKYVKIRG